MTPNAAITSKQEGGGPGAVTSMGGPSAEALATAAEEVLADYLAPGRWATSAGRSRFLQSGGLQRVLSLYEGAMAADPDEPVYPWNLASSLDRLGLHDLALVYIQRAIRIAEELGDEEWSDGHAHLAWADIAINAGDLDLALIAIEKARNLDPDLLVERYVRRARRESRHAALPRPQENRDSARKGKAVEHLVAASCMIASNFELNVSTSLVDDEGVDLVFHRRDSPVTLAVQVKSCSWDASTMAKSSTFRAQVRQATFGARADLHFLFVAVDSHAGDYGPVWLVPSIAFFDRTSVNARNLRRFVASAKPASRDQWSEFRLERSELPRRVLAALADLERMTETEA